MKTGFTRILGFCLILALILSFCSSTARGEETKIVIRKLNVPYSLSGVGNSHANVEELAKLFGAKAVSIEGGRAARINHMYYDKGVISSGGKAYVNPSDFFGFFGMQFVKYGSNNYESKEINIPMFAACHRKFEAKSQIQVGGKTIEGSTLKVKNTDKYIELKPIADAFGIAYDVDANGKLMIGKPGAMKRADYWIKWAPKIMVRAKDFTRATGLSVI